MIKVNEIPRYAETSPMQIYNIQEGKWHIGYDRDPETNQVVFPEEEVHFDPKRRVVWVNTFDSHQVRYCEAPYPLSSAFTAVLISDDGQTIVLTLGEIKMTFTKSIGVKERFGAYYIEHQGLPPILWFNPKT